MFHPSGALQECDDGSNNDHAYCETEPLSPDYNRSVGTQFCCEKRSFSYVCTNTFYTSDNL